MLFCKWVCWAGCRRRRNNSPKETQHKCHGLPHGMLVESSLTCAEARARRRSPSVQWTTPEGARGPSHHSIYCLPSSHLQISCFVWVCEWMKERMNEVWHKTGGRESLRMISLGAWIWRQTWLCSSHLRELINQFLLHLKSVYLGFFFCRLKPKRSWLIRW